MGDQPNSNSCDAVLPYVLQVTVSHARLHFTPLRYKNVHILIDFSLPSETSPPLGCPRQCTVPLIRAQLCRIVFPNYITSSFAKLGLPFENFECLVVE